METCPTSLDIGKAWGRCRRLISSLSECGAKDASVDMRETSLAQHARGEPTNENVHFENPS